MIADEGVDAVERLLSTFSSKYDSDIEHFLKERAIDFSNRGVARTHLVTQPTDDALLLLGYYTITNKVLEVPRKAISKSVEKRLARFGLLDENTDTYSVPMPLIAQLGKNYSDALDVRISGDELINLALSKISEIQYDLSGKYTYIECFDTKKLIEYYERNDFRRIDSGSPETIYDTTKPYLVQMLKYFS
ncbi:MAG: N-acetyltransferase [Clostridiales Family XIII bacterium]|nr:N-acetyltransferase [Clostridiales Family XIII bacterium]